MLTYRPARADEVGTFHRIRRDAFGKFIRIYDEADHAKEFAAGRFEIIENAGEAIGHLHVETHDDHLFVDEIALLVRGRGFGTAVMRDVMRRAADAKRELRLSVFASNPALRLYERLGFRVTHVVPPRVKMSWWPDREPRTRCSVFIATSADGYIARADGGIDWLSIVEQADEDYGFARFYASIDTIVMGSHTYETALGFPSWPYADKHVVVLSSRALVPQHGVTVMSGEPDEVVRAVGQSRHVYVDGGVTIRRFLAARAIDRVTISVIPIVLGGGIRLFEGGEGDHRLALVEARPFDTGLVQLEYRL